MESSTPSRSSCFARCWLAALGAIALLLSAPASRAAVPAAAAPAAPAAATGEQGEAKARADFKRGKTAYDLGRFDEALAAYTSAYEAKPLPAFLFNMAQCHKQMGNWERASFFYKRYLALSPSAKDEAAVKKLVEEADAKAAEAEKRKAELQKQEDARAAALIVAPPPPADPLLAKPTPGLEPERAAATPIYKTWWFWTGVGVVVAAAAGGTTAAVLSKPQAPATTLGTLNAR
jgi:tetratricopeptide (TPR) repeat protein